MKLTDLPVEILTIIVRMARDQDERLKQRLLRSRERVTAPTREVMKLSKWYGISLLALRATCQSIEKLANPFVFESVKLSKCSQDVYFESIIPKYSSFVRTARFDRSPNFENAVAEFVDSFRDLPFLQGFTFENTGSIAAFETLYVKTHPALPPPRGAGNHRTLRPLFASLSDRITHLACLEVTSSQMVFLMQRFPKLRSIKRRLLSTAEEDTLDDERGAYLSLASLKELDISTLKYGDEIALKRLRKPPNSFPWSDRWKTQSWTAITTLNFGFDILTCDDWKVLQHFRVSLEHLTLEGIRIHDSLLNLEEEDISFPNLSTLKIVGDGHLVAKVLRLFKASPLVRLDARVMSVGRQTLKELFQQDQDELSELLRPFSGTLKYLNSNICTIPLPQEYLLSLEKTLMKNSIIYKSSELEETYLFSDVAEKVFSIDMRPHPARQSRCPSNTNILMQVEEVAEYVKRYAQNATRDGDSEGLNRVATLLRPLAAMQLIDKE